MYEAANQITELKFALKPYCHCRLCQGFKKKHI